MAAKETKVKVVLLLQAQKLLHRTPVVQLVKVEKKGTAVEMDELPLTSATINQYLKHVNFNALTLLTRLSPKELEKEKQRITLQLDKAGYKGKQATEYRDRAFARYFQSNLGALKNYANELHWYHRITTPGSNRVTTAPCTYHPISAQIEYEAFTTEDGYGMQVWVKTREGKWAISEFRRFYFLLVRGNDYWHLNQQTFEALDWLDDQTMTALGDGVEAFIARITAPLKKMGQTVKLDALIKKEYMEVLPEKRVLLSELNNLFLMLTPQFLYDGYVVDGAYTNEVEKQIDGKPVLVKRNEIIEKNFNQFLKALHPNFARQNNGYFYLTFADAQKKLWFIHTYHQLLGLDVEITGMDMLRHFRYSPHVAETKVKVLEQADNYIVLDFQVSYGKEKVPLGELQKMLLGGQKVVMLKDGSMGVLGEEWLQQYSSIVKHGKVKGGQLLVPKWLAISFEDGGDETGMRRSLDGKWLAKWKQWVKGETAMYALPPQVKVAELRSYQQKGYDWMNLLAEAGGSACLADDMGLGKTLQTICFISNRLHHSPDGKHLVVCPASLIYTWQQEFEKFAPSIKTVAYHGPTRDAAVLKNNYFPIVITSYGTLRQDIEILSETFFDVAVIDESHHIKNPSTKITRAVNELKAITRVALSGTPVMNGTQDLYAQLNFLLPGLLGSREFFRREYAIPIEQQRDTEKAKALQKLIAPFVLRRTKEQVAPDLPPKTEMVLWCEMGQDQKAAYESIKENIRSSVLLDIEQNGLNKGKMGILAGLTKLRQACNSCELVKGEDLFTYDSIKTEMLLGELQNIIPAHKALVFSQFTSMLDLLERDLQKAGITYQRLDGSTAVKDRQELVNQFQDEDTDVKVFLLSLKAGNAGLTLTAADYVFLFDPWWNAAVENQAIDRTHRIGQDRHVFAYRMICKGTVEEKIMRMQQQKKKLAEELVSTDEGFMQSLTLEDVKYLLQ